MRVVVPVTGTRIPLLIGLVSFMVVYIVISGVFEIVNPGAAGAIP
jgi:hypothetical protein